jgi:hypothetical protein
VAERVLVPLELGSLPWNGGKTLFERLGDDARQHRGDEAWSADVLAVVPQLRDALLADYVLIGGGNVERLASLPTQTRRGGNDDAFTGEFRLWEEEVEPRPAAFADLAGGQLGSRVVRDYFRETFWASSSTICETQVRRSPLGPVEMKIVDEIRGAYPTATTVNRQPSRGRSGRNPHVASMWQQLPACCDKRSASTPPAS